ncbi:MAG: NAD-dependent epimerase/dehydratase family protein [Ignavibacteriaceae bacterium]
MTGNKPASIVITGASGFVGRFLLESIREEMVVFAMARRSRKEANIPYHKNIHWIQCDIANSSTLKEVREYIKENGGADAIIHLAAYYDFTYKDNSEYLRTNVEGTRNILEFAKEIGVKKFIFASSLAACNFSEDGEKITEKTPPMAEFAYAMSKRKGEEYVKEYSKYFQAYVVRFAAVFSDWCEYAPLYKFLSTWLSKKFDSRILAGKGNSAIPYIHVHDIVSLFRIILKNTGNLPNFGIYSASPDGSVSHKDLHRIATAYYFGKAVRPYFIPRLLAYPGLVIKHIFKYCHFVCDEPFEKFWMIKYIDKKLDIDSGYTRNALNWEPAPRLHITRRLLFLLEKMKSHPDEWRLRNEAALRRVARRDHLIIYEALTEKKDGILQIILERIETPDNASKFNRYKKLDENDFKCYISTLYHLLMATVRSGDRSLMLKYIDDIAMRRFAEGFQPDEICGILSLLKDIIIQELKNYGELKDFQQVVYDYVGLTLQIAQDAVEDLYETLLEKIPRDKISKSDLLPDCKKLQSMIKQLSAFYQISPEEGKYYEDLQ